MSGVDLELARKTAQFLLEYEEIQEDGQDGNDKRLALIREYVAWARTRIYRTGGGSEGRKDVLLDIGVPDTICTLVPPVKPGTEAQHLEVKIKRLSDRWVVIDQQKPVRLGSICWITEDALLVPYVVMGSEPVWAAGAEKSYYSCELERVSDGRSDTEE